MYILFPFAYVEVFKGGTALLLDYSLNIDLEIAAIFNI